MAINILYFFSLESHNSIKLIWSHLKQNWRCNGHFCDLVELASKLVLHCVHSVWEEEEGNCVTECYTLSRCNKQIFWKYESYKSFIIYQGRLCISFKLGNTVNPGKLQVEVIKKQIFKIPFTYPPSYEGG